MLPFLVLLIIFAPHLEGLFYLFSMCCLHFLIGVFFIFGWVFFDLIVRSALRIRFFKVKLFLIVY